MPEDETPAIESPALVTALKAFASLTREQKVALSRTLDGFVACLSPSPSDLNPNPYASVVITEKAWHNRANWGGDEWNTWETWGWYRQFCRAVRLPLFPPLYIFPTNFSNSNSILRICATTPPP